ncbi:MAG: hypothetical protein HETSPECPRED_005610 [Heterodermia speciosa]|uniref:Velvet domain-containing protein n=1 Tax=Heterodermia speciosa TaxID=116794 RepID=A0A8H3IMM0_9LECA|nr:MAG: hypothetical protein HETSPECPRED_005610 [Heterodermia speciosa]
MYAAHQERPPPLQPPLAMERQAPAERNGQTYPTPSSTSHGSLPKVPQSPDEPGSVSCEDNNRVYSLEVVQQPIRARMCGFGDKDRRPITPPPCIKLIVKDAQTGKDIDINEIDTSFFVLTVDLWSQDASKEVNLVRHSATSPSISAATSASYPPRPPTPPYATSAPTSAHTTWPPQNPLLHQATHPQHPNSQPYGYPQPPSMYPNYRASQPLPAPPQPQYHLPQQQYASQQYPQQQYASQQHPGYYPTNPSTPIGYYPQHVSQGQGPLLTPDQATPQPGSAQPSGMFTRNLIGSLCVSAFKLTDPNSELGIWFILQDLSVRTEGSFRYASSPKQVCSEYPKYLLPAPVSVTAAAFRLKMNFVNVGSQSSSTSLNTTAAPVLASIFSGVFQVFSAKKFPGVIESTPLSKCFATQGIKIPIRKDGPRGNVRDREEFEEDNE